MKFGVSDLQSLSKAVREISARERTALSVMLDQRQADFCEIIDEVATDPCVSSRIGFAPCSVPSCSGTLRGPPDTDFQGIRDM
jgi:hypothetical protein